MSEDEKLLKEAKKLPWEDRLTHKNWKVRNDGCIDLAGVCDSIMDPKDPRLREFGPLFKKSVADSNAAVQEKALDALIGFLRAADADVSRYAKEVCDSIAAKCLTGRPKTIEKAQAAFMLWVELEASDVFLDTMEKAIKNKVAKAVVPAIDVMYQALSEFGTKIIPPKRILRILPELFDHQDQNVRASAKGLTIELCRWIGKDSVKSILFEKMRDTMKKEIEAEMDNVTGVSKPTRKIRSEQTREVEQEAAIESPGAPPADEASPTGVQDIDEYDLVDPVDILTPLGKSSFWDGVKAAKWSERRDAVAELTKLASAKRLAAGDYTEICRTLKKLITDVNIAVAVEAIQAAGNLASGLRKDFTVCSRILLPVLLDKLKEKKQLVVDALMQTLQSMHTGGCVALADVIEDVRVATKNKVPSVRSSCLNWVTFCIENNTKLTVMKLHKDYVPILMESLNDGTPEVRDAAFSALAAFAKHLGMKPLERSLEKLDEVRRKKLTEMIGSGPGSNTSTPSSTSVVARSTDENSEAVVKKSAASLLSGKKPTAPTQSVKKTGSTKVTVSKKGDATVEANDDIEVGEMSLEEIESRVGSIVQPEIIENLKSAVWKERLEAMTSLKETVEGLPEINKDSEILVRLLSVLPGWAEKNVQVQQKVIEVVCHIAERATSFSKKAVMLCLPGLAERSSDIKTRAQATRCLTVFCEVAGPNFVFDKMYKIMKEHRNPKVLSEGLSWMITGIEDFGISHIKLKDLLEFCKDVGLQSSAPATRNATIKLIGVLHKFVGPGLKNFLTDVKPALQSALDTEYEKNPYEGPAAPKRTVRGADDGAPVAGGDGLPREDVSGKLSVTLMKNLGSPEWKIRQESIETVNRIIEEANKRIQATGTGELFGALKGRLNDSNKNLVMMTLSTLGSLAAAMGPAVDKNSKGVLADVLKCLGDNKKLMREAVIKTLDGWAEVLQLDKMLPYIVPALIDAKLCADGRKDLFDWVTKQLTKCVSCSELTHLLKPISVGLQDKSVEVRKAADAALQELLRVCGFDAINKASRELHGSALAAVLPILEKQRSPGAIDASEDRAGSKGNLPKTGKQTSNGPERPAAKAPPRGTKTVGKVSKQAAAIAAQDAAVQGQALFNMRDSNKEERERSIPRKYKFEEPRPEQILEVEADVMKYFREDLHRRLLSPDFKKQVDGLELLQKAIPTHTKDIAEISDILLRWIVLRFCESNTTCLLKVLDFLPELVEALKNEGYALTEFEATIFLPCLVEKSGHNIEKVREKMRELMRLICCIYPASKLFTYICEGLRSKNNRTRIESVDHIGFMVDRYGVEIAGPNKALQSVAALTTERDGDLRKAALQTLATVYKIMGDDVWRYLGKLSDAQKSMIDDKFKWKAREMDKRREGKPGETRAALRRSVRENGNDAVEQSGEGTSRPITAPPVLLRGNEHFELASASPAGPSDWSEALDTIEFGSSPEQVVEGMKLICHELSQMAADMESSLTDDFAKDADRLVRILTLKVTTTFNMGLGGASSRSCKYVLNTLMQTFQLKKLAHGVREATLHSLITELLLWLLDERVPLMDDGSQLLKALNVLMLKILENAGRTSAFVVLIRLLRPLESRWPGVASEEAAATRGQKFSDLVVKCLIKLTKVLGSTIFEVDLDRLLQSIHEYLQELGMEEIRRRAGADDKPLRMVKTVLHELVKLRGTAIKGHLSMVPIDTEPQPIILAYIDLNLQTLAAARMLTPTGPTGQTHWVDSSSNGPASPAGHTAEAQLKQELAAVFKKIGDKQTCTIGLYELYRITQLYPQVDIFSQLQNASEAFRTYIRNGLAQMEKSVAAGRAPTSIAMVTPPPASPPSHSSPKMVSSVAPISSRVQPLGLDNNVNYNYREEVEAPAESDTAELKKMVFINTPKSYESPLPSGDIQPVSTPSSGTLDAIRERMRSIQAAATAAVGAGSIPSPTAAAITISNGSSPSFSRGYSSEVLVSQQQQQQQHEVAAESGEVSTAVVAVDDSALSGLQARMERLKSGGAMDSA
ncbi:protein MOR1 [Selaginella moellendorffii]|uniref:protein MOR1 n=1 Tax=Selaginella moellendorffii TaxID=88036 RepID=UPI000D1C881E|nr:protein MOR1 [Selaginella moellendorffii]|eukprot:XP_024517263.1 protein MOR1 [Selaginella moellendorffii]